MGAPKMEDVDNDCLFLIIKCLDAKSLARAALSCSRFYSIITHPLFWSTRARGSGATNLSAFLSWTLISEWLRQHARGSSDPLREGFPISQEAFTPNALQPGDHVMILGDATPTNTAAQRSTHAIIKSFDRLGGCFIVAMDTANDETTYQRRTALSLFQAAGINPYAPADALRIQVIRSGSGHLSTPEEIIERARAFLTTGTPLRAIEGLWHQFAFGFFCQTGHLISWDRFQVWYRNRSTHI